MNLFIGWPGPEVLLSHLRSQPWIIPGEPGGLTGCRAGSGLPRDGRFEFAPALLQLTVALQGRRISA